MAYVFNGINAALDGKTDEDQKQDIFNAQPAVQENGQPGVAGGLEKTSTEGELGATNQADNAATSEQEPQQTEVQNAEVIKRNVDKAKAPKGIDRVDADLSTAETGLQDEANSYVKNYADKDYSVDTSMLDKAADGDDESKVNAMNRFSKNADQVDQFNAKTDYDVEDSNMLRTDAGVQELMRRDSDQNYNQGESAFDMMLLRRNKDFNERRAALINRQDAVRQLADKYRTDKTTEAQGLTDQHYAAATDAAKGYLDKSQGDYVANLKAQVAKENALRDSYRTGGDANYLDSQKAAAIQGLVQEYQETGDPNALAQVKYLQETDVDPSQFYSVGRSLDADKDYGMAADAAGANRFNRIMQMLGRGDSMQAGAGLGPTEGFDKAAYRDAAVKQAQVKFAAQQEAEAEAKRQAEAAAKAAAEKAAADAAAAAKAKADADAAAQAKAAADAKKNAPPPPTTLSGPKGDANPSGGFIGTGDKPMMGSGGAKAQVAEQAVKEGNKQVSNTKKEASKKKEQVKSWCFPAGVCFKADDDMVVPVEELAVGDVLAEGGVIETLHQGESDDLFYYKGALVTGGHPVLKDDNVWALVRDVPASLPVPGLFTVYSVTCSGHRMIHESGIVFGDYETDDLLNLAR